MSRITADFLAEMDLLHDIRRLFDKYQIKDMHHLDRVMELIWVCGRCCPTFCELGRLVEGIGVPVSCSFDEWNW